jgi:signal transduction histidine kinase
MSDDVRAQAFDPFFSTKPTGKGTGLGLSTVYGVVRPLRGWISLNSELGLDRTAGSKYRMRLLDYGQTGG